MLGVPLIQEIAQWALLGILVAGSVLLLFIPMPRKIKISLEGKWGGFLDAKTLILARTIVWSVFWLGVCYLFILIYPKLG